MFFQIFLKAKSFLQGQPRWVYALIGIFTAGYITNCLLFYPGYMSPDSLDSLNQIVTGHMRDWHPPLFTLIWGALFHITGKISSMLFVILLVEWSAWLFFAIYLYTRTRSCKLSLVPLVLGFSPIILTLSGVVWKDVLMANALALGTCFTLALSHIHGTVKRRAILIIAISLFLSAALLRYNILLSLMPLLYLLFSTYGGSRLSGKSAVAVAIIFFVATSFVMSAAIDKAFSVEKTHPSAGIMVDDIIHIDNAINTRNSHLNHILNSISEECGKRGVVVDGFIVCSDPQNQHLLTTTYYNDLKALWLKTLVHHPVRYALYRIHAYFLLLFSPSDQAYIWQDGVIKNNLGIHVASIDIQGAMKLYVVSFGYSHFPFLFEAWFWIGVSLIFMMRRLSRQITLVALSGLAYMISYLPLTVATDYRYIYWSVWACLICLILYLADKYKFPTIKRRRAKVAQ